MALESVTICPICKGSSFSPFSSCIDLTTSQEEFSIVKCVACDLLITSPRPDFDSIGKYYNSDKYISHTNSSKNILDKGYKLVRSFTLKWKLNLIAGQTSKGKILDFGCGTGEFLNECKHAKWVCYGVEPSDKARAQATELTSLKIAQSTEQFKGEKFDVITLWHVLEHIENLNEKILQLKSHLVQNGTIIIAVPNHQSLDAQTYKSFWAGYDVPRHLWHFSQENIKRLLKSHGLNLVSTIPMKQDSYYVSLLSEKNKNSNQPLLINITKALLMGLRSNLAARKDQNYSSLVYIAKS